MAITYRSVKGSELSHTELDGNFLELDNRTAGLSASDQRIALGSNAGETGQGISATAVGYQAGQTNQGIGAVAIGNLAGVVDQGLRGIAIGSVAGNDSQGQYSIALGYGAGGLNQGEYAVAIGYQAGAVNQTANSIVINGGSTGVLAPEEGLYVSPIRNVANTGGGGNFVFYDSTSKEITYSSVDFGAVVSTQIQTNGIPLNTEANELIAREGQILYIQSRGPSITTTNVAFTYDTNVSGNVKQTFYGTMQFGDNGEPPVVDFTGATVTGLNVVSQGLTYSDNGLTSQVGVSADVFDFGDGKTIDMQNSDILFSGSTVIGFPTPNNNGIVYQLGYSAHDAVSLADGDFSVNSVDMVLSLTAGNLAQGVRIDISGVTTGTSAGTGPIYIQRRVNGGSWLTWNAFIVNGADDHFSHSFVDFYDTGGTDNDIAVGDTVEYKLTNGTTNVNFASQVSGAVDFELFWGFNFTATEVPLSYSLIQP